MGMLLCCLEIEASFVNDEEGAFVIFLQAFHIDTEKVENWHKNSLS